MPACVRGTRSWLALARRNSTPVRARAAHPPAASTPALTGPPEVAGRAVLSSVVPPEKERHRAAPHVQHQPAGIQQHGGRRRRPSRPAGRGADPARRRCRPPGADPLARTAVAGAACRTARLPPAAERAVGRESRGRSGRTAPCPRTGPAGHRDLATARGRRMTTTTVAPAGPRAARPTTAEQSRHAATAAVVADLARARAALV